MLKLSEKSFESFGQGLEIAFGDAREAVHFYKPDVLAQASRPSDAMAVAAPMPTPANEAKAPFIPSVVNG